MYVYELPNLGNLKAKTVFLNIPQRSNGKNSLWKRDKHDSSGHIITPYQIAEDDRRVSTVANNYSK